MKKHQGLHISPISDLPLLFLNNLCAAASPDESNTSLKIMSPKYFFLMFSKISNQLQVNQERIHKFNKQFMTGTIQDW